MNRNVGTRVGCKPIQTESHVRALPLVQQEFEVLFKVVATLIFKRCEL